MHLECLGKSEHILDSDVSFAALNTAHVSAMDPGKLRECLLAESGSQPKLPYSLAKLTKVIAFHAEQCRQR